MKLLVLLSRIPFPLEKGDKLRAYHQIKELSKSHQIFLICLNKGEIHPDAEMELKKYCKEVYFLPLSNITILWNVVKAFFNGNPLQVGYFYSKKNHKIIHSLINTIKPDHLYCQLIRTSEYIKLFKTPKTIDYQDVFSFGMKRRAEKSHGIKKWIFEMESRRLAVYENQVFPMFDHHTIISETDRDLMQIESKESIEVVRNGVDFDYFVANNQEKKYDIVFTGNMGYAPNINAAEYLVNNIMPLVWEQLPKCTVLLAGANPSSVVKNLKSELVTVTGWMMDIREAYSRSKVFVAPMQIGTGLQNKLLEAMAMKIPCITSELANKALGAEENTQIQIGRTPSDYANKIVELLTNRQLCEYQTIKAHQYIVENYSWSKAVEKLERILKENI